jgi:hypothetical protein
LKYPLLYIEWCDAQTLVTEWQSAKEVLAWAKSEIIVICQSGYLLAESKKYLVLASKYNPQTDREDQFAEITKIPKTWITKRKRISISS